MSDESTGKKEKTIKEMRKEQIQHMVLAAIAILVIIAFGLAWFVSNTRVSATGIQISSQGSRFELASKNETGSVRDALSIDGLSIDSLFGLHEDKTIGNEEFDTTVGGNSLGLYLQKSSNNGFSNYKNGDQLMPGDSGSITFYIKPVVDDVAELHLDLKLEAYILGKDSDGSTIVSSLSEKDGGIADSLLQGHILFFQNKNSADAAAQYSGWTNIEQGSLVIRPSTTAGEVVISQGAEETSQNTEEYFVKDTYYKLTFYWIWPKYFRNYAYLDSRQEDLFGDGSNPDYTALMADMNNDKSARKYFYAPPEENQSPAAMQSRPVTESITSAMSNENFNLCTRYYNEGDQYLGDNVKYVLFEVTAQE